MYELARKRLESFDKEHRLVADLLHQAINKSNYHELLEAVGFYIKYTHPARHPKFMKLVQAMVEAIAKPNVVDKRNERTVEVAKALEKLFIDKTFFVKGKNWEAEANYTKVMKDNDEF